MCSTRLTQHVRQVCRHVVTSSRRTRKPGLTRKPKAVRCGRLTLGPANGSKGMREVGSGGGDNTAWRPLPLPPHSPIPPPPPPGSPQLCRSPGGCPRAANWCVFRDPTPPSPHNRPASGTRDTAASVEYSVCARTKRSGSWAEARHGTRQASFQELNAQAGLKLGPVHDRLPSKIRNTVYSKCRVVSLQELNAQASGPKLGPVHDRLVSRN